MRWNRWLLLVGACFAILILAFAGFLRPMGDLVRTVTLPVVRVLATAVSPFSGQGSADRAMRERVTDLESRLTVLSVDYVKLRSLEEENRSLRAQAKFLASSGYDSVGARVISRQINDNQAELLIDRGQTDHVEVGQAVVTNEGILIGKVASIQERVATVQLLADARSRVAAAVSGQEGLVGVLEGRGNGATALTYVPSSQPLSRDQVIVTAGTEEKVPVNLPLGIVNAVEGKPTDPFITAAIEPLVSIERVTYVSILRPSALRPNL